MAREIKAYFVLPSQCEDELGTSEEMQEAFEACQQNHIQCDWIREKDVVDNEYTKKDVVIFEKFEGDAFKQLCKSSCLSIIGPRCLLTCLLEGISIPNNNSPVYTMAMNEMKISFTSFSPEEKKKLKQKTEYMGGKFYANITDSVQFLVTNGVRSTKYLSAANNSIPIMTESWIEKVWKESLAKNVKATNPEFIEAYKCPPFYKLCVSSTGFDDVERNELKTLFEKYGGIFNGKMSVHKTHMLICKSGVQSDKFSAARKAKIPCVSKQWVLDSIKAGYALKETEYEIKISSSTPTKFGIPDPNFSMMSMISGAEKNAKENWTVNTLDTSCMSVCNNNYDQTIKLSNLTPMTNKRNIFKDKKDETETLVMNIDLKEVKHAGHFLDGCGVYIAGFNLTSREKLIRILKLSGATRYEDISDRITQIIAGDQNCHELKLIASKGCSAPIVSVNWLLESIKQKQPVFEEPFLVSIKGSPASGLPSSPLVKKGLNLLRANTSMTNPNKEVISKCLQFDENPDEDQNTTIMKQYLNANNKEQEEEDTLAKLIAQGNLEESKKKEQNNPTLKPISRESESCSDEEDTNSPIFKDKTFVLIGLETAECEKLISVIELRAGIVKSCKYRGIPDYAVVSTFSEDLKEVTASEIVNDLWVLDCDAEGKVLTPKYFHQPVERIHTSKPLENCVVTISNYTRYERIFLRELLEHLGAFYQEKFSKACTESIKKSTHLLCNDPTGKKYQAAISWKVPIITHEWLLECCRLDCKVDEKKFGLGTSYNDVSKSPQQVNTNKVSNYFPTETKSLTNKLDISITRNEQPKQISSALKDTPKSSIADHVKNKTDVNNVTNEMHYLQKEVEEKGTPEGKNIRAIERKALDFTPENSNLIKENNYSGKDLNKSNTFINSPGPSKISEKTSGDDKLKENNGADCMIEIDGKNILLSDYIQSFKDKGLFDQGSPIDKYNISPFVVPMNIKEKVSTPKNINDEYQPSQDTPVAKYIKGLQQRNVIPSAAKRLSTPDSPLPQSQFDIKTPDTPLGAFMCENDPSPDTRKFWQRKLNKFPHYKIHDRPPLKERRQSTPFAEVKRQVWAMLLDDEDSVTNTSVNKKIKLHDNNTLDAEEEEEKSNPEPVEETESQKAANIQVTNQLKQLQNMMKNNESNSGRRSLLKLENNTPQRTHLGHLLQTTLFHDSNKDSQPDTIGWDDPIEPVSTIQMSSNQDEPQSEITFEPARKFMFSSMTPDLKNKYEEIVHSLGGIVSNLPNFDSTATHLLCGNPSRNEKFLSCMASGKYVLHPSYLLDSQETGKFLEEDLYEFGNPKSLPKIEVQIKSGTNIKALHWWRKKISEEKHGAFYNMRILLFSSNKSALVRLIEAGDGVIVNASPPFTHNIEATHCLVDLKLNNNMNEFIPLAKQGIKCLNVMYLSSYLNSCAEPNDREFIPQELQDYY